jgi:non-ribosomal peptide synthetase component F
MMANLSSVLEQAAARHGERPAVRLDDLVLSYSQLRDAAGRAAALLSSLGVVPGDRVGGCAAAGVAGRHPAAGQASGARHLVSPQLTGWGAVRCAAN